MVGSRVCKSMLANLNGAMLRVGSPRDRCWVRCFFIVYIRDLDTEITSDVSMFADDTKIGRVIQSDHDASVLQDQLDTL